MVLSWAGVASLERLVVSHKHMHATQRREEMLAGWKILEKVWLDSQRLDQGFGLAWPLFSKSLVARQECPAHVKKRGEKRVRRLELTARPAATNRWDIFQPTKA